MKVVIIEDEAPAARRLIKLLTQIDPSISIVKVLESVQASLAWFSANNHPDLIFSDIQLADNLSFELFSQMPLQLPIIFTTAFDHYAIKAFEHLSIDYLLKPIRQEHLEKALKKYRMLRHTHSSFDAEALLNLIKKPDYRDRFLVSSGENLKTISITEVAYMYSENGVSFLVTTTNKKNMLNDSLDKIEKGLDPKRFFRANRQFILSVECIKKVSPDFNQKLNVYLEPNSPIEVVVSKLKASEFKNWLNR